MKEFRSGLLMMRLSVFTVLLMWTLDKFLNPTHGSNVLDKFFGVSGVETVFVVSIGVLEMAVILLFVSGVFKRFSYGVVFLIHGVSTIATLPALIIEPFGNLLFFAGLPMLAACYTLYRLRAYDTLLVLGKHSA
ncbi:hypothetical protein [Modicisalibacter sp. 'Wilcox']|uniref:hypothetical protein n=1 Tax=Modicisalibacter sp. 'Wilcox' TaxID=2679914 RepID=UPI0013D317B8|nr:hypothetical protein [Modicisalibacter sp. 'Wilcox']